MGHSFACYNCGARKFSGACRVAAKGVEVEVKLAVANAGAMRRALRRLGFVLARREWERDIVLDTRGLALRRSQCLLRLRHHGRGWKLTFKGPAAANRRYKTRPETEIEIPDGQRLLQVLEQLGYRPVFRYEKQRSTYLPRGRRRRQDGITSLDETPIGTFLELEGPGRWIDRTAQALGFSRRDYITRSYASLYRQYCRARGRKPSNMVFGS